MYKGFAVLRVKVSVDRFVVFVSFINVNFGEAVAIFERIIADGDYAVGNRHARDKVASIESFFANALHRSALVFGGNNNILRGSLVADNRSVAAVLGYFVNNSFGGSNKLGVTNCASVIAVKRMLRIVDFFVAIVAFTPMMGVISRIAILRGMSKRRNLVCYLNLAAVRTGFSIVALFGAGGRGGNYFKIMVFIGAAFPFNNSTIGANTVEEPAFAIKLGAVSIAYPFAKGVLMSGSFRNLNRVKHRSVGKGNNQPALPVKLHFRNSSAVLAVLANRFMLGLYAIDDPVAVVAYFDEGS